WLARSQSGCPGVAAHLCRRQRARGRNGFAGLCPGPMGLQVVVPEIFISAVICAFHAAKSHSFRTPRLSFKRSPGRLAAKAGQNRRGIVPFARHKKIALRKGTPLLAIMRSSHLML